MSHATELCVTDWVEAFRLARATVLFEVIRPSSRTLSICVGWQCYHTELISFPAFNSVCSV